jgi:hypothetical protein
MWLENEVYVLRHADGDQNTQKLCQTGLQRCQSIKRELPSFDLVVCCDLGICKETARELGGLEPRIDERVGVEIQSLYSLITSLLKQQTLHKRILIISHEAAMKDAERGITAKSGTPYGELEGFIVGIDTYNDYDVGIKDYLKSHPS